MAAAISIRLAVLAPHCGVGASLEVGAQHVGVATACHRHHSIRPSCDLREVLFEGLETPKGSRGKVQGTEGDGVSKGDLN